jgi:predicted adenylyl cyclase CyaB
MARNIEIKARVRDLELLERKVLALGCEGPKIIDQQDTFFPCRNGRLKLRTFSERSGELIFYERVDQAGSKASFYLRTPTSDPGLLCESLRRAWGILGVVKKRRRLYLKGRTRIHLDQVALLGDFLELEVVLESEESDAVGREEAEKLISSLGIERSDLIEGAYIDLLAARSSA